MSQKPAQNSPMIIQKAISSNIGSGVSGTQRIEGPPQL